MFSHSSVSSSFISMHQILLIHFYLNKIIPIYIHSWGNSILWITHHRLGPLLLTYIIKYGMKILIHSQLQRCSRWSLGRDRYFRSTLYWKYGLLSMLGIRLIHVSKRFTGASFLYYICDGWDPGGQHVAHFHLRDINTECTKYCFTVSCQYAPSQESGNFEVIPLQWRHNGRRSVSNHRPCDCLLNAIFGRRSKKTSKLRFTGLHRTNGQ